MSISVINPKHGGSGTSFSYSLTTALNPGDIVVFVQLADDTSSYPTLSTPTGTGGFAGLSFQSLKSLNYDCQKASLEHCTYQAWAAQVPSTIATSTTCGLSYTSGRSYAVVGVTEVGSELPFSALSGTYTFASLSSGGSVSSGTITPPSSAALLTFFVDDGNNGGAPTSVPSGFTAATTNLFNAPWVAYIAPATADVGETDTWVYPSGEFTVANQTIATIFLGFAPPNITSLSVYSGAVGDTVTITGNSFGSGTNGSVVFNGTCVASITSWSDTSITFTVPSCATTGFVAVLVNGVSSNSVSFTVTGGAAAPIIPITFVVT